MPSTITPTLLPPNLVWRSYLGGNSLRRFRSLPEAADNHFPEDWLASTVRARNGEHASRPVDGLSPVFGNGNATFLPDLLRENPEFWFGGSKQSAADNHTLGVLWKLLDSSVRL